MTEKKRNYKKIILTAGIILLVLILGGTGFVYKTLRSSLPVFEGNVSVKGLSGSITIHRDDLGRPHIYASTRDDLFFGQGYAQAQDRLWQMELHRRAGQGRISEIVGASQLDFDIQLRTAGLTQLARSLKEKTSPEMVGYITSYAEGINAYLEKADTLPPEFQLLMFEPEPWTVDDVFGAISIIVFSTSRNHEIELLRYNLEQELEEELFLELIPPDFPVYDVPPVWTTEKALAEGVFNDEGGSAQATYLTLEESAYYPCLRLGCNGWALSPHRSETGEALFSFDSHGATEVPNQFYENRLISEDGFELYGWSVPGMPGMLYGLNSYLAWGMSNVGDTQDLFLEQRHPDNPRLFLYDDEWYEAKVRTEKIKVRFKNEPEVIEVVETRNGFLISEDPPISLRWSAHDTEEGFDALAEMNFARNWEEFREALNKFTMPSTQITYADVEGNIASRTVGLLPVRKKGAGASISPGWDPDFGWDGFIPVDELPELFNPPDGYVAAANAVNTCEDYPYIISVDNDCGYRMRRITDVLEAQETFTVEDMKNLQTDWYNAHAEHRLPALLKVLEKMSDEMDETEEAAMEVLSEWQADPVNNPESAGAVIFEGWYMNLIEDLFQEEMGDVLYEKYLGAHHMVYENIERFLEQGDSPWFKGNREGIIFEAFRRVVAETAADLGDDPSDWRWDEVQTISFEHIIGQEVDFLGFFFCRGPYPFGGGPMTINRGGYRLNRPFEASRVSIMRLIADMGPEITAYGSMPVGQSGHPLSPHYDDQIIPWIEGEYFPLYLNEKPPGDRILLLEP